MIKPRHLALLWLALFGGCDPARSSDREPIEESPWTRPVPSDVRTILHRSVPAGERELSVRLTRELVIGEREGDFEYLFGNAAPHVSVDSLGRMFVADVGNDRVLIFDADGNHLRTLGRSGQGPGEFVQPMAAVVAGARLFVSDTGAGRLSRWTLEGELEWDIRLDVFPGYLIPPAVGLMNGSWLIRFRLPRSTTEVVALMSQSGERTAEFAALEVPPRVGYPPDEPRLMIYAGSTPPSYAADAEGRVYVSPLEEYQVFAYGLDGSMRWALQLPHERSGLATAEKEWATGWFRNERYPDIRVSEVEWPEREFALADLKVDGRGRIYVFPYVPRGMEHDRLPVDVYASDGSRLLAGWLEGDIDGLYWLGSWKRGPMLDAGWQTTRADLVYGVVQDPATGVYSVVRYRLDFPRLD